MHAVQCVDRSTYTALRIMLSTWRVQAFNWSLYMGDSHLEDVSWVQTKHYGGQYPFLKLLLPSILNHIQNVIVLDTDLIFLKDIAMLWEIFSTFEGDEVIAVAENLSGRKIPRSVSLVLLFIMRLLITSPPLISYFLSTRSKIAFAWSPKSCKYSEKIPSICKICLYTFNFH